MRHFSIITLLILTVPLFAQPDTTLVLCPQAIIEQPYFYSDYSIYLGDESSLVLQSTPDWVDVVFELDTSDWETDVIFQGTPGIPDYGHPNDIWIGWLEWNYELEQEELWHVFQFRIPICSDIECIDELACNYNPCSTLDASECEYESCAGCNDPQAFNYDPEATIDDSSCVYCTPGDWNDDGQIDILDIVATVMVILSATDWSAIDYCRADGNQDGMVDVNDIVLLISIIMQTQELPEECYLEPDIGPCDGNCPRYYFNQETEECQVFYWGCCDGIVPFETQDECEAACE